MIKSDVANELNSFYVQTMNFVNMIITIDGGEPITDISNINKDSNLSDRVKKEILHFKSYAKYKMNLCIDIGMCKEDIEGIFKKYLGDEVYSCI